MPAALFPFPLLRAFARLILLAAMCLAQPLRGADTPLVISFTGGTDPPQAVREAGSEMRSPTELIR